MKAREHVHMISGAADGQRRAPELRALACHGAVHVFLDLGGQQRRSLPGRPDQMHVRIIPRSHRPSSLLRRLLFLLARRLQPAAPDPDVGWAG